MCGHYLDLESRKINLKIYLLENWENLNTDWIVDTNKES